MSTENTDALPDAGQADSPHAAHAESVSIDSVVDVAIKHFSRSGFAETKLETIAQESGMSKRMIHYHFGDKKGLYLRALSTAAQRLNPPQDALEIDTAVPVEGVRKLVDWLFRERVANPDAIRMLVWESNQQIVDPAQQAIADVAGVALHLDLFSQVRPEDLVKFGLIPEFIGRLPVVATVDNLDRESLVKVLTEPKNSLVKQYSRLFEMDDCELEFEPAALDAIAELALERKTGARGLRAIMEELLVPVMYDLPDREDIAAVHITPECVTEGAEPQFSYKDEAKESA